MITLTKKFKEFIEDYNPNNGDYVVGYRKLDDSEIKIPLIALDNSITANKYIRKDIDDYANGIIKFNNGIVVSSNTMSTIYLQGLTGWFGDQEGNFEMNSLILREFLEVPELRKNKITVMGNQFWFTDSAMVKEAIALGSDNHAIYFKLEAEEYAPFELDDILKGIYHYANGFYTVYLKVYELINNPDTTGEIGVRVHSLNGKLPMKSMLLARMNNSSKKDRQGSIFVDGLKKYIRVLDGYDNTKPTSEGALNTLKVQVGDLSGIKNHPIFGQLEGYGIYAKNAYIEGKLIVKNDPDKPGQELGVYRGAWSNTSTYYKYDLVTYKGSLFTSKLVNNIAHVPVGAIDDLWWELTVSKGDLGSGGLSNYTLELSNDNHSIPTDYNGLNPSYGGASSTAYVYEGSNDISDIYTITASVMLPATPDTLKIVLNSNTATITYIADTLNSATVLFTATATNYPTLSKEWSISKVKAGNPGDSAIAYWLVTDSPVIKKYKNGTFLPNPFVIRAFTQVGSEQIQQFSGYIKLIYGATTQVVSGSVYQFTPVADVKSYTIELYKDAQTTILLDKEIVSVVEDGKDAVTPDWHTYIFKLSTTKPATPTFIAPPVVFPADGWYDVPSSTGIWWMSTTKIDGPTSNVIKWSEPVKTTGEDGTDGTNGINGVSSFKSVVFRRLNTKPNTPTGGSYLQPIPLDWTDGPTDGLAILWSSTRVFSSTGLAPQTTEWTSPSQMTDTALLDIEYSSVQLNPGDPTTTPANWSNTASSTTIWMATRTRSNGIWSAWEIVKVKGETGLRGVDGTNGINGANGISIIFKGSLTQHPANPLNGWAYYNTTDGRSYVYQSGLWYQMTVDGTDGSDGKNGTNGVNGISITWKGESTTPPANPQVNWVYKDTDNGVIYIYNGTAWELMVLDGTDGINGTNGITYYTWVLYSDNPDGVPMYQEPKVSTNYIGIAVNQTVLTEGTNPAAYQWTRFRGDTGIPGVKGVDGLTYYTWLKYADTDTGTGMSNSPIGKLYMGLAYNKLTQTESTIPTDYAWSLIKGDKGDLGLIGLNGNDGLSVYITYHDNGIYTTPAAPTGNGTTGGWHTTPDTNCTWLSLKVATGPSNGVWGAPIRIKGENGGYVDFKYAINTLYNVAPTLANNVREPQGWVDSPGAITSGLYMWMTHANINPNNTLNGLWAVPVRINGEKGDTGSTGAQGLTGPDGLQGPSIVFGGVWSNVKLYYNYADTQTAVYFNGKYYYTKTVKPELSPITIPIGDTYNPSTNNGKVHWNEFVGQFDNIATGLLLADRVAASEITTNKMFIVNRDAANGDIIASDGSKINKEQEKALTAAQIIGRINNGWFMDLGVIRSIAVNADNVTPKLKLAADGTITATGVNISGTVHFLDGNIGKLEVYSNNSWTDTVTPYTGGSGTYYLRKAAGVTINPNGDIIGRDYFLTGDSAKGPSVFVGDVYVPGYTVPGTDDTTLSSFMKLFNSLFEKVAIGGLYLIKAKLPLFSIGDITAYGTDTMIIPSLWDALPVDKVTIDLVGGKLTVIGDVGGGIKAIVLPLMSGNSALNGATVNSTGDTITFTASTFLLSNDTRISNWNTAYNWGNHASAGYLTSTSLNGYLLKTGGLMSGLLRMDNTSIAVDNIVFSNNKNFISGIKGLADIQIGYGQSSIYLVTNSLYRSTINGSNVQTNYVILDAANYTNYTINKDDSRLTNARVASDVYAWAKAAAKPLYAWQEIGNKPTTVSGFGITDAVLTNDSRLTNARPASDVYAWAKSPNRPTYTSGDVGASPSNHTHSVVAGLAVHGGRNNEANKIIRTDGNGYLMTGYINSSNGDENINTNPDRVWGTNGSDSYLRTYRTSALNVNSAHTLDGITRDRVNCVNRYTTTAMRTGWYKININSYTLWMLAFTIHIYLDYLQSSVRVSGYNYGTNHWHEVFARMFAGNGTSTIVKFGFDSDYHLWVAIPCGRYTGMSITDVVNGYTNINTNIDNLFTITWMLDLTGTVQYTREAYYYAYHSDWNGIFSKPTTIGGFGITDAVLSNDSRLTNARIASDVYSWAKLANKPLYAWEEVGNKPQQFNPAAHQHGFVDINGLMAAGNEFNVVPAGYNSGFWFNYKAKGLTAATINGYYFGNASGGYTTLRASGYVVDGGNEWLLLNAIGGVSTFAWSGNGGLPTWLWGGNSPHSYSVWNPSNFRVANANTVGDYGIDRLITNNGGIITGPLLINPTIGNYSEGLRIANHSDSWSNIQFGCAVNATIGLNPDGKQWLIGKNPNGDFLICPNSSSTGIGLALRKDSGRNGITWYDQPVWHAGNDGSGSGLDADLLDGVQFSHILEKNKTTSFGLEKTAAWYRIGLFKLDNATSPQAIIMLHRSYNSPTNEGYTFSISLGYNGTYNITLLSGEKGSLTFTQCRIDWTNSGIAYLDVYLIATSYNNTMYVTAIGAFLVYDSFIINPTTGPNIITFVPGDGLVTSGFITSNFMYFRNYNNFGNAGYIGRGSNTTNNIYLRSAAGNSIMFGSNGIDERMVLDTIGNLFCKNTIGSDRLFSRNLRIECDNTGNVYRSNEINNYKSVLALQHDTANNLYLCFGGGKVGIGGLDPNYKLTVLGNTIIGGLITVSLNGVTSSFGSENSSYCHYRTSAPTHYFNTNVTVNGVLTPYGGAKSLGIPAEPWSLVCSNEWFRSIGTGGWYSLSYGGGIYMTDISWVLIYGSKGLKVNGVGIHTSNNTYYSTFNTSGTYCPLLGIDSSNYAFVGTTEPTNGTVIRGYTSVNFNFSGKPNKVVIDSNGNITAAGEIAAYSDIRLKTNITNLLNRGRLQAKLFTKDNKISLGFIAQDVLILYPELVNVGTDLNGYLSLNYGAITAVLSVLINAVEDEVVILKQRIKELELKLNNIENDRKRLYKHDNC